MVMPVNTDDPLPAAADPSLIVASVQSPSVRTQNR